MECTNEIPLFAFVIITMFTCIGAVWTTHKVLDFIGGIIVRTILLFMK